MFNNRNYKKLPNKEKNNSIIKETYIEKIGFLNNYSNNYSYMKKNIKIFLILLISLIIILFFAIIFSFSKTNHIENNDKPEKHFKSESIQNNKSHFALLNSTQFNNDFEINKTLDYETKTFGIITRKDCPPCGLFSYYSLHLGCILIYLSQGYIPIIDVRSFPNAFNGHNTHSPQNKINPWEVLFNQPFGYTLDEVKKNAKKIEDLSCSWTNMAPAEGHVYSNQLTLEFYREMSRKYMSIKKEIMDEANITWEKLFGNTKNVLGALGRGTDFVSLNPDGHSIPPSTEKMIEDVKKMDEKNKYDWIYLATEDDDIRNKFKKEFGKKLKMVQDKNIDYTGGYIGDNPNLQGIEFQKLYLLSMIILSKCIDVVVARCSGAMGAFIFSEGFRESIVYFLGQY